MLKFCAAPVQLTPFPVKTGETVSCAVIGFIPLFTATKGLIFPEPAAPIPIVGMLFVQL